MHQLIVGKDCGPSDEESSLSQIDVFNGDADGICALQQLRLHTPCDSQLVTGIKRDIRLMDRLTPHRGDTITVLDISLDKNRPALIRALDQQIHVTYFDHHYAGDIPDSPCLSAHIDTSAETCTSLLVNNHLNGAHLAWAVVGAFGDNLHHAASQAALPLNLSAEPLAQLQQLGECINYNGYGISLDDLHFHPDRLYQLIHPHSEPFSFINESSAFQKLSDGYAEDMAHARTSTPSLESDAAALYLLPDRPWARRASGMFGNELARNNPRRAHAIISETGEGYLRVSVRAPLNNREHADTLCMKFPTGGGRKAAAGINELPESSLDEFIEAFTETYR